MEDNKKRNHSDLDSPEIDSPEVKRLREDLLDDFDEDPEICTSNYDLDSFMKSFEEEITTADISASASAAVTADEPRPDLGYLLEASDDDLGIPPPPVSPGAEKTEAVTAGLFEGGGGFAEYPGDSDSFGFGFGEADSYDFERVAIDGLFDGDFGFGDVAFRPETLPAQ